MVRRRHIQPRRLKLPLLVIIGKTHRDAALAVDPFKETDHHDPEVQARRQGWPPQFCVIEAATTVLTEAVKTGLVENLVQAAIERMTRSRWQLAPVPQRLLPLPLLPTA